MPGVPGISLGRTQHMSWGITTPIPDTSDLWQETINDDDTKYFVDGEWRDLIVTTEIIKIKGQEPLKFEIKSTHRGAVYEFENLQLNAGILFGGKIPYMENAPRYSLKWGSQYPGDISVTVMKLMYECKTAPEALEMWDKIGENGYNGFTINLVFADNSGNIAYVMGTAHPIRKDKTPYIGCRVLDGETTEWDWEEGIQPSKMLPRSLNPAKGFIATANNR
jgi:penicillin amidase